MWLNVSGVAFPYYIDLDYRKICTIYWSNLHFIRRHAVTQSHHHSRQLICRYEPVVVLIVSMRKFSYFYNSLTAHSDWTQSATESAIELCFIQDWKISVSVAKNAVKSKWDFIYKIDLPFNTIKLS